MTGLPKLSDELLASISGGKMQEGDIESLRDWIRLCKDMGNEMEDVLAGLKRDYDLKIDYDDLVDTDGKLVTRDELLATARKLWDEE